MLAKLRQRDYQILIAFIIVAAILAFWRPHVLISGLQRGSLYVLIALPVGIIYGILGILNLAHGEFMMLGAFFAFSLVTLTGIDPLIAMLPAFPAMFVVGIVTYRLTIKHVVRAPLNQFLLTFGLAVMLAEMANLIWTTRPRIVWVPYAASSATIGPITFGTFEFVYVAAAAIVLVGMFLFLTRTRAGLAAMAVGQNPRGAKLVGIDVERTYMMIFSACLAVLGPIGALFLIRHAIFPEVGGPFSLRAVSIVAMAGFGNLPGILVWGIGLGLAEAFVRSFRGWGGWADIIFFGMIILVVFYRSYQRRVR
ncbi:MAG: High-affinity branched-chain amino acid transport system permease protein LivH [Chloroflexi bacterium]|nr:High-affinity branched-chain amino acid transport system permease protein LivH [Chloroflexota bacterium]